MQNAWDADILCSRMGAQTGCGRRSLTTSGTNFSGSFIKSEAALVRGDLAHPEGRETETDPTT